MRAAGGRTRVLVVDDSALMRRVVWGLLEQDTQVEVVGSAVDGLDAVEKVRLLKPDVVTLDVEMPRLDGLQTLGYLMSESPVACVMLSAYTPRGAETTLRALDYGAVDFVQKPSGALSLDMERVADELRAKVKMAGGIDLGRLKFRLGPAAASALRPARKTPPLVSAPPRSVIAIATSTGGPRALGAVIPALPAALNAPVLIVQHMSAGFTRGLADRLDRESALRVKEAEDGEKLAAGTAYLAPGDWHLTVERVGPEPRVKLDRRPPQLGVRPCADFMFQSVSEVFGERSLAVVLTGMGRDGVKGLKVLKAGGGRVIAQDEASSVVFGMPRAAQAAGCVDRVEALDRVASTIVEMLP